MSPHQYSISISTNTQYQYQYQGCSVSSTSTVQYQYAVSSTSNLGYIEVRFFMACVFGEMRTLKTSERWGAQKPACFGKNKKTDAGGNLVAESRQKSI